MQEKKLIESLETFWLEAGQPKLGLALSGGLDSMVLAESLVRCKIPFTAIHINHGWRGIKSDQDQLWVKKWCVQKKIPLSTKKLSKKIPQTEGAAREARLAFYQAVATKKKLKVIWLAHHQDDLVETFLIQLLRGASLEGLGSMEEEKSVGNLTLVRPLLSTRKSQLLELAQTWNLKWREDASNQADAHLRNRIRHSLLPSLEKITGRKPVPILSRCAQIIRDENIFWAQHLPLQIPEILSCQEITAQPVAWQRRRIRAWLLHHNISNISFTLIESVRELSLKNQPAKVNLSKGLHCRRRQGVLFIEKPTSKST